MTSPILMRLPSSVGRLPIRSLLFVLVAIVLLPFALFSALQTYYYSEAIIADAQSKQLRVATRIAKELFYALEDRKKLAVTLARRPELAQPGTVQCNQLMLDFKSLHEDILGAGFLDKDGVHRCTTTAGRNPPLPVSFMDTEWFQRIASERVPNISRPYFGKVRKQWLVVVAGSVLDSAG